MGINVPSCTYEISGNTKSSTAIITMTTAPAKVKITDAFTGSDYTTVGVAFKITCDGF